jgi:hypothetical protein
MVARPYVLFAGVFHDAFSMMTQGQVCAELVSDVAIQASLPSCMLLIAGCSEKVARQQVCRRYGNNGTVGHRPSIWRKPRQAPRAAANDDFGADSFPNHRDKSNKQAAGDDGLDDDNAKEPTKLVSIC